MHFQTSVAALAAVASVSAHDTGAPLDKPSWVVNTEGFKAGLVTMPFPGHQVSQWDAGMIPEGVQQIITNNGAVCDTGMNYNPAQVATYNVTYDDCSEPWVFSIHSNGVSIDSLADQFGRMPIQMRQWVRHFITVPDTAGHAFNCNGDIVFFNPNDYMIDTIIHETGHSLDLQGAYSGEQLSDTDDYWNNYGLDANAFTDYGKTNMVETVAEGTVVAVFNENVEGQVAALYPNVTSVVNQMNTIITHARDGGNGNSLINQGQGGECKHNLQSSPPVAIVPTQGQIVAAEANKPSKKPTTCNLTW